MALLQRLGRGEKGDKAMNTIPISPSSSTVLFVLDQPSPPPPSEEVVSDDNNTSSVEPLEAPLTPPIPQVSSQMSLSSTNPSSPDLQLLLEEETKDLTREGAVRLFLSTLYTTAPYWKYEQFL